MRKRGRGGGRNKGRWKEGRTLMILVLIISSMRRPIIICICNKEKKN